MGLITKTTQASMDAIQFDQIATGNLYAGENLDNVSPCYINAADGKVYMSNASEADSAASFVGFTPRACKTGEPVTLMGSSTRFRYGTGLTPGAMLYIAETAGRLDSAATTGDTVGTAMCINATDIVVVRNPSLAG